MRVLIIEDDVDIINFLKTALESAYFVVDEAKDGEHGSYLARTNEYDAIILDNILPLKSGAEVCEEVRKAGKTTPIIIISGRAETTTKVELLNKGADDYLTKPFSFEELVARIRALLRRSTNFSPDILEHGDLVMDTQIHTTRHGEHEIYLTKKEFMLLELLLRRKGSVVSRSTIMEHVWDMNADPFSNTLESHILNVRKKLSGCNKSSLIQTIPGIGYKIDADD